MKLGRWIVSALVVLLVVYAASKVDWRSAGMTLRRAAPAPLVAAIVVNIVSVAFRGLRWWIFLRPLGPVPLSLAIRGAIVGSGFNNLLVANGGDATRALLVARATGVTRTSIVATLALDRIFDPICFGLLLFAATFLIALPPQLAGARPIAGIALIMVAVFLGTLVRSRVTEAIVPNERGWRPRVREFRQQVQSLATTPRFVSAITISILIWMLQIVAFALVARSVDIALPLAGTVAALLLTNTGLILRATPGNVGYFQFAYAVAAARFGVATNPAVAAALLLQVVQIVPVTLLALTLAPRFLRSSGEPI
jgi:glycosyltransferase 2 family protein